MKDEVPTPESVAAEIADLIEKLPRDRERCLVAIAGAPGSGKTTIANVLVEELGRRGRRAGLLPMDGFHLDNGILEQRGLLPRKGAPETFDLDGFEALVRRAREGGHLYVPVFDRSIEKAIAAADEIDAASKIIVVEGNYLCLDEDGWRDLPDYWDMTVFVETPEDVLERRLIERWLSHGFDEAGAREKALSNDIPNARRIQRNLLKSAVDYHISSA